MGNLFGARYYDARTSVWQSPDPALADILADNDSYYRLARKNALYSYGLHNPIKYVDPDGNDEFIYFYSSEQSKAIDGSGSGHVASAYGTVTNQTFFEANPQTSSPSSPMKKPYTHTGSMKDVLAKAEYAVEAKAKGKPEAAEPVLILQIKTSETDDAKSIEAMKNFFENKKKWKAMGSNCADAAKTGMRAAGAAKTGKSYSGISTPQDLAKGILDNNKELLKNGTIKVLKGDLQNYVKSEAQMRAVIKNQLNDKGN